MHLIKGVDFDVIVDHLALTYIIKSKAKPVTTRIKRLLELISSYSFNLYYMKGKDMILSDFLSRHMHDTNDLHEIIPISFNMYNTLYGDLLQSGNNRYIFSTDTVADERCRNKFTGSTRYKEDISHKYSYRKAKTPDTSETGRYK